MKISWVGCCSHNRMVFLWLTCSHKVPHIFDKRSSTSNEDCSTSLVHNRRRFDSLEPIEHLPYRGIGPLRASRPSTALLAPCQKDDWSSGDYHSSASRSNNSELVRQFAFKSFVFSQRDFRWWSVYYPCVWATKELSRASTVNTLNVTEKDLRNGTCCYTGILHGKESLILCGRWSGYWTTAFATLNQRLTLILRNSVLEISIRNT